MTILQHTGAASLQRSQILAELVEAGTEGVSEARIKELGGYHWENRIDELQRDHTIGWSMVDGEKYYFLVSKVECEVERDSSTRVQAGGLDTDERRAAVSLNPTPPLFEHVEPSVSAYDEAA